MNPSQVVARRIRKLREQRGWSAQELADRCAEAGMPELNRAVIANIELGRRARISIDEVLVFALVLDVAPLHLFVPVEGGRHIAVQVGRHRFAPEVVRRWTRGIQPLPGQKGIVYLTEVPEGEWSGIQNALTETMAVQFAPPS